MRFLLRRDKKPFDGCSTARTMDCVLRQADGCAKVRQAMDGGWIPGDDAPGRWRTRAGAEGRSARRGAASKRGAKSVRGVSVSVMKLDEARWFRAFCNDVVHAGGQRERLYVQIPPIFP
jgi:hypothetical protein